MRPFSPLLLILFFVGSTFHPVLASETGCPKLDISKPEWVLTFWRAEYDGSFIRRRLSYEPDLFKRVRRPQDSDCFVTFYSEGLGRYEKPFWKLEAGPKGRIYSLMLENGHWVSGTYFMREIAEYDHQGRRLRFTLVDRDGNTLAERVMPIPAEHGLHIKMEK